MLDYIRIACAVPEMYLADPDKNAAAICDYIAKADRENADIVLFPEMSLTGYTCADLFFQEKLLHQAISSLHRVIRISGQYPRLLIAVGLPVVLSGQMYNCGAVILGGKLQGLVPKTYLPNYSEFYERRWFSSSEDLQQSVVDPQVLGLPEGEPIPVGRDLLFHLGNGAVVGVEICEDLWTPLSPSTLMALGGAEVILNLSASNEIVGKRSQRRDLVRHQSRACSCVYAYASAGSGESTQDLIFSGHSLVASGGTVLAENEKPIDSDYMLLCDADLGKIRARRRQNKSVKDAVSLYSKVEPMRAVRCSREPLRSDGTLLQVEPYPFVPRDSRELESRCENIFAIQAAGLARRLQTLNTKAVIGVSGGLDSTMALLVAVEAMKQLGRPASDVHGITMPCFGTTDRTRDNACKLMERLGVTARQIPISQTVTAHFADLGYDAQSLDLTYENSQARERTQVLMDYAGMVGGIVVGTGDLSELALGWCTYNGDHMSMYSVNGSVPKTVIPYVLRQVASGPEYAACRDVIEDIVATPISPELLPAQNGSLQATETLIGPYALHDFFLYQMLQYGYGPEKIYRLACRAFTGGWSSEEILHWMQVFYRRFFTQQFKRSCMPEGIKVGSVCLNPRGDWRMPSDASAKIWLQELEQLQKKEEEK